MADRPPNVLIITGDQWRRNSLGFMQQDPVFTPHFDRFASQGTVCERAYSCSPLCTPARAAFLTGRHPWGIDMMYNWQRCPVDEPNLATAAAAAGYDTALIGKWHLDDHEPDDPHGDSWNCMTPPGERRLGFRFWHSNGCIHDHWRPDYLDTAGHLVRGSGWQVDHETDVAIDYIRNDHSQRPADRPWLLWLSWAPPHNGAPGPEHDPDDPRQQDAYRYFAPREFEQAYEDPRLPCWHPDTDIDAYRRQAPGHFGCISSMDRNFGRLMQVLEQQGLENDTIVLVTADHGEMFGTHGRWMKDIWYEPSIGVPFMIRWPGRIPAGLHSRAIVNTPDVMPTLLSYMGVACPAGRDGINRAQALCQADPADDHIAFLSFCTGAPPPHKTRYEFPIEKGMYWRGLRDRRYTYACVDQRLEAVWYDPARRDHFPQQATRVVFDNEQDPWQQQPIYPGAGHDQVIDQLHQQLSAWLDDLGDPFLREYWRPQRST